ncbi:hypothetical protein FSHL1_003026 [Fusarium sambucinum]
MRVLRSHTRRAAAADEPPVVTPQKKVSSTNKTASKDVVNLPTPPLSTRKGKVTKTKKATAPKKQKKEASEASQDVVSLTDDTLPTPAPSTRKGKGKVTKPVTEDEPSQAEKETEPEEQEEKTDQPSQAPVDLADVTLSPLPSNRKRKLSAEVASSKAKNDATPKKQKKESDQASEDPVALTPSPSTLKRKLPTEDESPKKTTPNKKQKKEKPEKRLRKFRTEPPKFFDRVLNRSLGQTFYIISRTSRGTETCPEEDFELVGSSGNTYTVSIGKRLSCNCPHHSLGFQQCKHIIFIMKKVLNAPDELVYQQALISTELKSLFDSASSFSAEPQEEPVKRRPIEGGCPICYCKLDEKKKASIVWCSAACGHNFHMQCLKICARPGKVKCPVCRSDWKGNKKLVTDIQMDEQDAIQRFVKAGNGVSAGDYTDENGEVDTSLINGHLGALSTSARWYKYSDHVKNKLNS